jgi:multisubunit Na+/H+ antiporter MnhG subunit
MKLLHVITLFATIGLALARDFFARLGFEASYPMIGAFGLAVATLMIFRSGLAVIAVGVLAVMVSLPEARLQEYGLDHDILLAAVLLIVIYPWIRKLAAE